MAQPCGHVVATGGTHHCSARTTRQTPKDTEAVTGKEAHLLPS